jgi:hypothetical protein
MALLCYTGLLVVLFAYPTYRGVRDWIRDKQEFKQWDSSPERYLAWLDSYTKGDRS